MPRAPGRAVYRGFPKLGVFFVGPNIKDYSIWGSILGSPSFGKLPYRGPLGVLKGYIQFMVKGFRV